MNYDNLMTSEKLTLSENIKHTFLFILFLTFTIASPFAAWVEVSSVIEALNNNDLIFKERSFSPSLILCVPMFGTLTGLLWLKIKNTEISPSLLNKWFKLCGITLLVIVVTIPVYTNIIENKIESEGYSICNWYGRGSIGAPDIWVSSQSYCIKEGFKVRVELIDWLKQQTTKPTPKDVMNKINELLTDKL